MSSFAKKFPPQNARQMKNLSHKASNSKTASKNFKGTPKIHSVWTTNLVGIIQLRNKSCFCILCKNNQEFVPNEAGEKKKKIVSIIYFFW